MQGSNRQMRKEPIMKKYLVGLIVLSAMQTVKTYDVNEQLTSLKVLINTAFKSCTIADVHATLESVQVELLNNITKQPHLEATLKAEQAHNIETITKELEPLILENGAKNKQLHDALMHALDYERSCAQHNANPQIDATPWTIAADNINALNQFISSASQIDDSQYRPIEIGLATLALATISGSIIYKGFTTTMRSVGRNLIKPASFLWEKTVKALTFVSQGKLKELSGFKRFAIDMLLQFIIMKGLGETESLMSKEDQEAMKPIIDQIHALSDELQKEQEKIKTETDTALKKLQEDFKKSRETMQASTGTFLEDLQKEFAYITHLMNISQGTEAFTLNYPITHDLLFKQAPMLTPNNAANTIWYNVWNDQNSYGNWLYDPNINAFVQYGAPLGSLKDTIKNYLNNQAIGNDGQFNPYLADYNQIFTEYFPTSPIYTISVDVTLLDAQFPFCCGIAFNKARWLAGSLDRSNSYRFIGIVGTLVDKNNKKTFDPKGATKKLAIYFNQTSLDILDHRSSPVAEILSKEFDNEQLKLCDITQDIDHLGKDPLTYSIQITVRPDYQIRSQEFVDDQGSKTSYKTKGVADALEVIIKKSDAILNKNQTIFTINNFYKSTKKNLYKMNEALDWYHGIGFIAPRCQASFTIHEPAELQYKALDENNMIIRNSDIDTFMKKNVIAS